VARGEKVVSTARSAEARIELEPAAQTVTAEVTTTEQPAPPVKKAVAKKIAPKADPKK